MASEKNVVREGALSPFKSRCEKVKRVHTKVSNGTICIQSSLKTGKMFKKLKYGNHRFSSTQALPLI